MIGWYKLCDSWELKIGESGYYQLSGVDIAAFRTKGENNTQTGRGEVKALDAFCPHLGANLGVGGVVKENCLECPFHGWIFDGNGKCIEIPYAKKVPEVVKTGCWSDIHMYIYGMG